MLKLSTEIMDEISGIHPTAMVCVGSGFVREEIKTKLFQHQKAISATAITNPRQLCQLLAQQENLFPQGADDILLANGARVELLRRLFKEEAIRAALPVLAQQRFRPHFYEKLDASLQQGRRFFAHAEEAEVLSARLDEAVGVNEKRSEFFLLNRFWEKILEDRELWDDARLFESATTACHPAVFEKLGVTKIYQLEHFTLAPRAQYFWNELAKHIQLIPLKQEVGEESWGLEKAEAHSLEDAAFFLFDEISAAFKKDHNKTVEHALVIQDLPVIRRTMKRMAHLHGIPFFDPRDPMALNLSEEIKSALVEFEMVAKNFPGSSVSQWISLQPSLKESGGKLRAAIQERGIQQGIASYQGHVLQELGLLLLPIEAKWPKRISLTQLKEIFTTNYPDQLFWETFFEGWLKDLRQVSVQDQKKPLRYWYEQVREKLKTARPPSETLRTKGGLQLFRVDQAVSLTLKSNVKLHFFGLDSNFFEAREWTNDWFSQREIDVLSREFGLPSKQDLQNERENSFLSWIAASQGSPAKLWTYLYHESGTECDSLDLTLSELPNVTIEEIPPLGAHPRLLSSWSSQLKLSTEQLTLPEALKPDQRYSMSFLDDYSECPFVAYSSHVISAYDEREADYELKGDSFGQLIHLALEKLIRDKLSPEVSFDQAWKESIKKGWFFSERISASIRYRSLSILKQFWEQEVAYRERAKTEPLAIEDELKLELVRDGFTFSGRADRIDQHPDGVVVIDYKTQSSLTNGQDILTKGKGLQLALYGLALKDKLNQEVVGAQYIQLSAKEVKRNLGILFKKWNGSKVENAITIANSRNRALIDLEPDVAWAQLNERVLEKIVQLKQGDFSAKPIDPKDCGTCRYQLSCGWVRRSRSGENQTSDSTE